MWIKLTDRAVGVCHQDWRWGIANYLPGNPVVSLKRVAVHLAANAPIGSRPYKTGTTAGSMDFFK
jgi:hypothetical protein